MDKDNLYLNLLADTFADQSNGSDAEKQKVFHLKSFIKIMTTLKEIIEKQDEISHHIDDLSKEQTNLKIETEKIQSIEDKLESIYKTQNLLKIETDKIQTLSSQIKELIDSHSAIYKKKITWAQVKVWTSAFAAASGFILGAMAWLNQMGVFSIVWNVKK
jgi:uncharacterized protein YPO0396